MLAREYERIKFLAKVTPRATPFLKEVGMAVKVGDAAPEFNLKVARGEEQEDFKLSNHRGRRVVIAFYALDFTPV